ncbi:MAG: 50S ribosomal protein L10 [Deltaproteobacteria bacterium]|nr:50S ribosomal protein L10 [Deltaproteobacteria bacterium]
MKRLKKESVVADLSDRLAKAQAVVVTDFKGLKVKEISALRRKISEAGGEYQVAKNTLINLAVQGTPNKVMSSLLTGNTALGFTYGDPTTLAKSLTDYAKANDKFTVKGGAIGGRLLDAVQVKAIADLPSREALLSSLLGTMNAVPTGFVRVLAAVPQGLLFALSAIKDQKAQPEA